MDKINNTPVVLVSFRKLKLNCQFWEKYSIELYISEIQLKKKIASKNIFWKISAVDTSFSRGFRLQ